MKPLFKFVMVNRDILSLPLKFALSKLHPISAALVKTTFAPTMAKGSDAPNVLPPYAEAIINCRIISGDSTQKILSHIKKVAGKNIEVTEASRGIEASAISPIDTPSYNHLANAIRCVFSDTKVAPYMFIAATDSRFYYPVCKNVYRFTPFFVTEEEQKSIHAINEKCPVDDLKTAVEFFIKMIENSCVF
jgi:carboxypeptidase PM20D1